MIMADVAAFEMILSRIMAGESLKQICESYDPPVSSRGVFYDWLASDVAMADRYARACEVRSDHLFDEMLHIADTPLIGEKRKIMANQEVGPDGEEGEDTITRVVEITTGDMVEHRRLQIDARKWAIAKMQPKKYGDKLDVTHGGAIAVTGVEVAFVRPVDKT